ncbi:hypothetical protein [Halorussus sp. MSC15.2]|uniref:hypothetical protein n=1 Tax=Halorussus sp. MSC15.2 TaxID=2283638 RepID=UPI0013D78FB1|nr:hypothetical protein [Halorussus sp. MSC15.2]NEU55251.1 hypothetical protein [Halorussus sp. MSC15.2]
MTDEPGGSGRTMRDTFSVWNVDATEREVVLRSSDDQYVAVPLPDGDADLFERLAESSGTVDATLVGSDEGGTSWRVDAIHGTDESA